MVSKKTPLVHPVYGPQLVHRKRHEYKPMSDEQKAERETPAHLSFVIEDDAFAAEIDRKLQAAQWEHKNFYFRHIETMTKHIFQIDTKEVEEDDLKKILFLVGLKSSAGVRKR